MDGAIPLIGTGALICACGSMFGGVVFRTHMVDAAWVPFVNLCVLSMGARGEVTNAVCCDG